MSEFASDDARLRATEAQMRRALGLQDTSAPLVSPTPPVSSPSGSRPQRRRFIQDGEVPVTVIHRDHRQGGPSGVNQLEAARQALRSEVAAKERADRLLDEARDTIRGLQTKLAHERVGRDEALQAAQRALSEKGAVERTLQTLHSELAAERSARQAAARVREGLEVSVRTLQAELAAERDARQTAELRSEQALAARQEADELLRQALVATEAQTPSGAPSKTKKMPKTAGRKQLAAPDICARSRSTTRVAQPARKTALKSATSLATRAAKPPAMKASAGVRTARRAKERVAGRDARRVAEKKHNQPLAAGQKTKKSRGQPRAVPPARAASSTPLKRTKIANAPGLGRKAPTRPDHLTSSQRNTKIPQAAPTKAGKPAKAAAARAAKARARKAEATARASARTERRKLPKLRNVGRPKNTR
jgi:hypothetical protein